MKSQMDKDLDFAAKHGKFTLVPKPNHGPVVVHLRGSRVYVPELEASIFQATGIRVVFRVDTGLEVFLPRKVELHELAYTDNVSTWNRKFREWFANPRAIGRRGSLDTKGVALKASDVVFITPAGVTANGNSKIENIRWSGK